MTKYITIIKRYFYTWALPCLYLIILLAIIAIKTTYFDVYSFAIYIYGVVLIITYAGMLVFARSTPKAPKTRTQMGLKLFLLHLPALVSFILLSVIIMFSTLEIN